MAKNNVIVISLSVVGKPSAGGVGIGKSSLCNRLMMRDVDNFTPDKHKSTISQTDFVSPVINQDHFLYWGSINFQDDDALISIQILEHTEFTEDSTLRPFNATQNYIKRCSQLRLNSPGKMKYINCDQIAIPDEFEKEQCPNKIIIDGFIFVFDVSLMKIAEQESQKKYAERLLPLLVATKKPIIFVATKCDNLDRDSLNYLLLLATKRKTYQVVETSMVKGINMETPFVLMINQITKKFPHIKNLLYPDALIIHEQVINEMILLFQKYIDQEITNFRLKVAQIIPNIKSNPEFVRISRECGSQKPRSMISQHLRKLREEVEQVKSEEFLERFMLALKSCLPNVPSDKYTMDQCLQDIEKSKDFNTYFVKLSHGVHWVDIPEGEDRISFGFLRTQPAKEFLLQYKERLAFKLQIRQMTEEFESAISSAKHIIPGLPLEEALMQLPLGASWSKLDKHNKKQIYDNMQENLFRTARNDYLSMLMENVSSLIEYREDHDDYMFTPNELKEEMLKNDVRFHSFDFIPDKRSEIEFNFLATLNLPKGDYRISGIAECLKHLAPTLEDIRVTEDNLFSISFENDLNIALLGDPDYISELKQDYIKASSNYQLEEDLKTWDNICFETFDFTKGQSSNSSFKPNACVCFISQYEDIELMRNLFKMLFVPDVLHEVENIEDETRWFLKARRTKLWGIPLVLIATTKDVEDTDEVDQIHKDGQFLADSVQCAFICDTKNDSDLALLTHSSIHLTIRCLLTTINQRKTIFKRGDSPSNAELSVAVLSLHEDKFKNGQVLIPFLQNQMNWLESYQDNHKLLFDSVLNYNTRITVASSFFTVFNYSEIRNETRHGFIFIFSVENKAAWEICRLFTHRYMKFAPVLLIAMLGDLKTNKLTRNAEELLHEARTFAMHYKLHLIGTSQSTWTAGSFAPFLDTIWNNRFSSALNQKKANPKQPVIPNMRPALPRLPTLPQDLSNKQSPVTQKSSLAGPNERYMRRLYGSQDLLDNADLIATQLSENDDILVGSDNESDVSDTYDTLDSNPEFEPKAEIRKHHTIEDFLNQADVEDPDVSEDKDLIYDTLESVPLKKESDSSLWEPPQRDSLVPVINIPTISTMGKQSLGTYSLLSVEEPEPDNIPEVVETKSRPESCYSMLNASEIEESSGRPQFPLPPMPLDHPTDPKLDTLPEYTEVDQIVTNTIEEVIYGEKRHCDTTNLHELEYEDPSTLTLPPPTQHLNIADIKNEDFPSYNTTFQQQKFSYQETEYSHIMLPRSVITPGIQPVSDYDNAEDIAEQIPDRKFIIKSESENFFLKETKRLQDFITMDSSIQEHNQQYEPDLEQQLAKFSDMRDEDALVQFISSTQPEQQSEVHTEEFDELYASPVKVAGTKPNKSTPKHREPQPDIEDIYAGVEPPPLLSSSAHLAEDMECLDSLLPPPPLRTSSLDNQVQASRPIANSQIDVIPEVEYSTVSLNQHEETFHTVSLEYPGEPRKRTLSKKEKKEVEKADKIKQRLERRSTKDNIKRTKSQTSCTKSSFSSAEETFTYFCQPLHSVIPTNRNIPIFIEHCINAIEGMSPNGMESEGIYRIPANQEDMISLIQQFEASQSVHLTHHTQNIHTLAGTLKCFFQKLPDPLISEESAANLIKITDVKSKAGKAKLKDALSRISPKSYSVLEYLILHLHKVSLLCDENKMTARNLAITFWPSLFRPPIDLTAFQIAAPIYEHMLANMIEFPSLLPTDDVISEDLYESVRVRH